MPAAIGDIAVILRFIRELAEYEGLAHEVVATEADILEGLFGRRASAEALIARARDEPIGFILFLRNFSTFTGQPGLYVEDVYVVPEWRGRGIGRQFFSQLARLAVGTNCARIEWWVLDNNESAQGFYRRLGAHAMEDRTVQRLSGDALFQLAYPDQSL